MPCLATFCDFRQLLKFLATFYFFLAVFKLFFCFNLLTSLMENSKYSLIHFQSRLYKQVIVVD